MDEKLRETTNLCVKMMNSKRQVKEKLVSTFFHIDADILISKNEN